MTENQTILLQKYIYGKTEFEHDVKDYLEYKQYSQPDISSTAVGCTVYRFKCTRCNKKYEGLPGELLTGCIPDPITDPLEVVAEKIRAWMLKPKNQPLISKWFKEMGKTWATEDSKSGGGAGKYHEWLALCDPLDKINAACKVFEGME